MIRTNASYQKWLASLFPPFSAFTTASTWMCFPQRSVSQRRRTHDQHLFVQPGGQEKGSKVCAPLPLPDQAEKTLGTYCVKRMLSFRKSCVIPFWRLHCMLTPQALGTWQLRNCNTPGHAALSSHERQTVCTSSGTPPSHQNFPITACPVFYKHVASLFFSTFPSSIVDTSSFRRKMFYLQTGGIWRPAFIRGKGI